MILFEYRHQLVNLVFGRSWAAANDPFGILALALPFRASYRLSDIVARARGYIYRRAIIQWFYAASIVVLGLVGSIWDVRVALGVTRIAVNWSMMTILTMRSLKIGTLELIYSLRPAAFTLSVCYLMIVIICLSFNSKIYALQYKHGSRKLLFIHFSSSGDVQQLQPYAHYACG